MSTQETRDAFAKAVGISLSGALSVLHAFTDEELERLLQFIGEEAVSVGCNEAFPEDARTNVAAQFAMLGGAVERLLECRDLTRKMLKSGSSGLS
jgi:hypothetical protein